MPRERNKIDADGLGLIKFSVSENKLRLSPTLCGVISNTPSNPRSLQSLCYASVISRRAGGQAFDLTVFD